MTERDSDQAQVFLRSAINCARLLTRLLPYIFEEPEWRGFFWSDVPLGQQQQSADSNGVRPPLAERLLQTLAVSAHVD